MNYVIFDDDRREYFFPLTLNRIVGDLRVGILKLRQRLSAYFEVDAFSYILDEQLQPLYEERHPDWICNEIPGTDCLYINSRLKINSELVNVIKGMEKGTALVSKDSIVAAKFRKKKSKFYYKDLVAQLSQLNIIKIEADLWNFTWDLIGNNSSYIEQDFQDFFYDKDNYFETEMGITVLNPYNIWIGEDAKIQPGVVIDASDGPVIIDEGAIIMANSVVIGPVYLGKKSMIKAGAKIYEGTSVGPLCKIGGEVEETIFQGYSNKQHDGFLGHSYIGEWVNIGADTNNSDLKNNYKNVKVYSYPHKDKISSNTMFQGTIIGDHTKIGINSTINTGAVLGFGCNLFGKNLISDFIPDFGWGEAGNLEKFKFDKFIETAEIVKKRRNVSLSAKEKTLFSNLSKRVD